MGFPHLLDAGIVNFAELPEIFFCGLFPARIFMSHAVQSLLSPDPVKKTRSGPVCRYGAYEVTCLSILQNRNFRRLWAKILNPFLAVINKKREWFMELMERHGYKGKGDGNRIVFCKNW